MRKEVKSITLFEDKGSRLFWKMFLRTFKDFYLYRLIEYVIGYIGRGFFTFTYSMGDYMKGFI